MEVCHTIRTVTEDSREESLALVARREALLRALEERPVEKQVLAERVGTSRSTVDRALRELVQGGLADSTTEGWFRTPLGHHLLAEYDRYRSRAGAVLEARPVLEVLPEGHTVPTSLLLGARVFGANQTDPYGPLEQGMKTVATADHVRSVVDTALARYADLFDDGLLPADGRAELCLSAGTVRGLLEDRPAWFERAVERPDVGILETDPAPPFTVALVERGDTRLVVFGLFDERGVSRGLVNEAPAAVEWAETYLDRWWDGATVVSPAER